MVDQKLKQLVEQELDQSFNWNEIEEGLNTIHLLESETENFILKVHTNKKSDVEWFRAEPRIYQIINQKTSVPSPEVVHFDFSEEEYEHCFYVMEKLEGENPAKKKTEYSDSELGELIFEYGKILGEIHNAHKLGKYGLIGSIDDELTIVDDAKKWTWSIEGAIDSLTSIIDERWENPPEIEKPDKEYIRKVLPEVPESVLIHLDNRLDNLLVKNNKINGFLDWSMTRAGHKEYDLVRAEYLLIDWDLDFKNRETREKLKQKLYKGYKQTNNVEEEGFEERRQLYRYCVVLWIAAGFPNWGSRMGEEERVKMREKIVTHLDKETL